MPLLAWLVAGSEEKDRRGLELPVPRACRQNTECLVSLRVTTASAGGSQGLSSGHGPMRVMRMERGPSLR